jgi:hypothetical protein
MGLLASEDRVKGFSRQADRDRTPWWHDENAANNDRAPHPA